MTTPPLRSSVTTMRIGLQKLDVAVAAAATAGICLQTWLAPATVDHHQVVNLLLWLPVGIVVAVRRRHPLVAGLVAGTLAATAQNIYPSSLISGAVAWMCDLYAFTVWTGPRTFWAGLVAYVGGSSVAVALGPNVSGGATFVVVSAIVMALVRLVLVRDRERRARIVERERELAAREAVVEERARIARELHDAIAHNVSMMVVQAGAERRVVSTDATREVLKTIEGIGRSALTEMRRLVGMLRTDEADPLAPQPGLAQLETLVAQVSDAGLPVELHVEGARRALPAGLDLSAYRIVQEALTNALKHAGDARASVVVRYGDDSLELEIVDDGVGADGRAGGGHGLVGMRERVALYGGRFQAGRRASGGFAVRVLLPTR